MAVPNPGRIGPERREGQKLMKGSLKKTAKAALTNTASWLNTCLAVKLAAWCLGIRFSWILTSAAWLAAQLFFMILKGEKNED